MMLFRKKRHTPESFWAWFEAKRGLLAKAGPKFIEAVSPEVDRYCVGLALEIGPEDQRPREFIVSAHGNPDLVDAIERLADAAPDLPDWKITRFRPPVEGFEGLSIEWDGRRIGADDLRFIARPDGPVIHVFVFGPMTGDDSLRAPELEAIYILLDMALGEYDVICRIGVVKLYPIAEAPEESRPWREIRDCFASIEAEA